MSAKAPARSFLQSALLAIGRRALFWIGLGALGSVALSFVELAISMFIQLFLKGLGLTTVDLQLPGILGRIHPTPADLAWMLTVIAVVRSIVKYVVGQSGTVGMEMINARLRRISVYEMLLHPEERIVPASTATLRISEHFVKASWFVYAFADLLANAIQALGLAAIMAISAWRESVIAVVGLGVLGLLVTAINRRNTAFARRVPAQLELLMKGIERISRNTTLVRALRTQRQEHTRFTKSVDAYAQFSVSAGALGNMSTALTPFVGTVLIVVIVVISQSWLHTPGLALLSFLYMFVRFTQCVGAAVGQLSVCAQRLPQFRTSVEYVGTFDDEQVAAAVETSLPPPASAAASVRLPEPPSVFADALSFRYQADAAPVLTDISLEVAKGSQLAIIGSSGSGKSTLLSLILGLLQPDQGKVTLDGRSPKDYFADPAVRIGYVGAEAFLLAGTIRDNLLYGARGQYTDTQLLEALEQARLRKTVEGLEGALDYLITEEGAGLSAGQKQRLCLARALLTQPHLLILDEASANLDEATEMEIADSLSALRGRCTTIVVSHRPGIIKFADRVVRMGT
jgi:ABC-type multidrug transport system fused ATPase/permease subunit